MAEWVAVEELMTAAAIAVKIFKAPLGPRPPALGAGAGPSGVVAGKGPPVALGMFRLTDSQKVAGLIS